MHWDRFSSELIPFPTPTRNREIYYPPYSRRGREGYRRRHRAVDARGEAEWEKSPLSLRDKKIENRAGDLGWTLEYATAWLFRHLVHNRIDVAETIDQVRKIQVVEEETPFMIFEPLNRALFAGRLRGMVYMRWKTLASNSPGITSAPGVSTGVTRTCIELNRTPFVEGEGDIDTLLDMQIHQMIHAWFMVACGAQAKQDTPDDRLLDKLHFGVLLFTIKDITKKDCRHGALNLIFYAAQRRRDLGSLTLRRQGGGRSSEFIAVNPRGSAVDQREADGQTHCCRDNRGVRYADLKNWQVENYSVEIELGFDGKGDVICDLGADNELVPVDRVRGPPSSTYIELIWAGKRVMVKREFCHRYPSIKRPLEKNSKMELLLPECSKIVFRHVYDFFNKGSCHDGRLADDLQQRYGDVRGPPIWDEHRGKDEEHECNIVVHLQTFKVAEGMQFEELQAYVLKVLWALPYTQSDPIDALKELYDENADTGPVHAELHKWAREFLARREGGVGGRGHFCGDHGLGRSNLEKIYARCRKEFLALFHRNRALQDDVEIVQNGLHRHADADARYPDVLGGAETAMPIGLPHPSDLLNERGWLTWWARHQLTAPNILRRPRRPASPYSYALPSRSLTALPASTGAWDDVGGPGAPCCPSSAWRQPRYALPSSALACRAALDDLFAPRSRRRDLSEIFGRERSLDRIPRRRRGERIFRY